MIRRNVFFRNLGVTLSLSRLSKPLTWKNTVAVVKLRQVPLFTFKANDPEVGPMIRYTRVTRMQRRPI